MRVLPPTVLALSKHQPALLSLELDFREPWLENMEAFGVVLPALPLLTSLVLHGRGGPDDYEEEEEKEKKLMDGTWHFPALVSLRIFSCEDDNLPLPIIAAPLLHTFDGPIRPNTAAAMLALSPSLTDVTFQFWNPRDSADTKAWIDAFHSGAGKRLERIFMGDISLSLDFFVALATAAGSTLRQIHGTLEQGLVAHEAMEILGRRCCNLEHIYLYAYGCSSATHDVPEEAAPILLPALHTLQLCMATDALLRMIRAPALTTLQISNYHGDVDVIFQFPQLETLDFHTASAARFHSSSPARGLNVQRLRVSSLVCSHDASLHVIACCPNVEVLRIHEGRASAAFFRALSLLPLSKVTAFCCDGHPDFNPNGSIAAIQAFVDAITTVLANMPLLKDANLPLQFCSRSFVAAAGHYQRLFASAIKPFVARGIRITAGLQHDLELFSWLE